MAKELFPGWKVTIRQMKHGKTQLRFRPALHRQIAHIEIGTGADGKRYFRLDLSPSKFAEGEFEAIQQVLTTLLEPLSYDKLFETVPVSYLELAFDSLTQPMSAFIPFRTKTFSSWAFPLKSGKGTYYFGAKTGRLRFAAYDKKKQLQEKFKQEVKYETLTRIEMRIHGTGLLVHMLVESLPNEFKKLEIADRQKFVDEFEHPNKAQFLNDCYENGSGYALQKLSVQDRRKFLAGLRKAKAVWWKPEWIWKALPDAIDKIKPVSFAGGS